MKISKQAKAVPYQGQAVTSTSSLLPTLNISHKIIGRDKEIDLIIEILNKSEKNNPLIISNPGTGKTSLVLGLWRKITCDNAPMFLKNSKIMKLNPSPILLMQEEASSSKKPRREWNTFH